MPVVINNTANTASTVSDTVRSLPLICQGYYLPSCVELSIKADKYFAAKHAREYFLTLEAQSKLPAAINSIKAPTLQVASEFRDTRQHPKLDEIATHARKAQFESLSLFAAAKKEEKDYFWLTYVGPAALEERVKGLNKKILDGLLVTHGADQAKDLPAPTRTILSNIDNIGIEVLAHVVEISRAKILQHAQRIKDRKTSKAEADTEMSGTAATVNEKTLERQVESVLKRKEQSRRDKQKSLKSNISPYYQCSATELLTLPDRQSRQEHWDQEEACQHKRKRTSVKRKIIEETQEILRQCPKRLRVERVGDYPDVFFSSKLGARLLFLQLKSPVALLRTLRESSFGVHKASGVTLPSNIEYFLSVNLKYIFPQTLKRHLVQESWTHSANKIRQWFNFKDAPNKSTLSPYLAKVTSKVLEWPEASDDIEAGLLAGRGQIRSLTSHVVPSKNRFPEPHPVLSELGVSRKGLHRFMLLNRYMAFITDKNLGIAVVKTDWYLDQVASHLKLQVYSEVPEVPWNWIASSIDELSTHDGLDADLKRFIADSPRVTDIPVFHAIPKIHKNPWKIRPIVPMHSYCSTRIAMVIHDVLHPLVREYEWICESSKSFVTDLLSFTQGRLETWVLRTADVQSMYTNIETSRLLEALREAMAGRIDDSLSDFVLQAVEWLNASVFFQFNSKIFWQKHGIAMGVACSPTLANLFMGVWEREFCVNEKFTFYRRYIDDIFALDIGTPQFFPVFPGLVLDWEAKDNIPFLDCEVHLHGQEVCVRPYTKTLAHYQYIPWSSGHPVHVKRSLVKTELLRYSATSAKIEYFDERKKRLHTHLRSRGYPERALQAWMRQVQWRHPTDRYHRSDGIRDVKLLAASEYNPVWESVKLGPVWDAFLEEVCSWREPHLPPFRGMTQSLQRTSNLWDEVRRINKESSQLDDHGTIETSADSEMILDGTLVLR
jgi:hypothetical protein